MSQKENLVEVTLALGEGRLRIHMHYSITKQAEDKALQLLEKETAPVSSDRSTKLYFQAMKEFPNEN